MWGIELPVSYLLNKQVTPYEANSHRTSTFIMLGVTCFNERPLIYHLPFTIYHLVPIFRFSFFVKVIFQLSTFKAASKREKSNARFDSSECEQARGAASIFNFQLIKWFFIERGKFVEGGAMVWNGADGCLHTIGHKPNYWPKHGSAALSIKNTRLFIRSLGGTP